MTITMLWPNGLDVRPTITSPYGARKGGFHNGVDFIDLGGPVRAIAAGTVTGEGWHPGVGWTVTIDHGDGIQTRYCHLAYRSTLRTGHRVALAQLVGTMGATGTAATGPHLHLDIYVHGSRVDPVPVITARLPKPAPAVVPPTIPTPHQIKETPMRYPLILHKTTNKLLIADLFGKTLADLGADPKSGLRAHYAGLPYATVTDAEWERSFAGFTYVFTARV